MRSDTAETAIFALLGGFIVSVGLVGVTVAAGGYQLFPTPAGMAIVGVAPAGAPALAVPSQAQAQTQVQAQASAAAPAAPIEVKVIATDLKFAPPTLSATVGQPIKIVLENKGVIEHDIAFPTLKADKAAGALKVLAKPGQTATLEFTPTAAGTYEYICTIPGHKEAGMKGTINVTE